MHIYFIFDGFMLLCSSYANLLNSSPFEQCLCYFQDFPTTKVTPYQTHAEIFATCVFVKNRYLELKLGIQKYVQLKFW